jgi:DNA-binding transcriptional regulator YhcF (GntR family)
MERPPERKQITAEEIKGRVAAHQAALNAIAEFLADLGMDAEFNNTVLQDVYDVMEKHGIVATIHAIHSFHEDGGVIDTDEIDKALEASNGG